MRHVCTIQNGKTIDVLELIHHCTRYLKPKKINIKKIQQVSRSKATGFSKKRYNEADIKYPIIIDNKFILIDGRHRTLKRMDLNKKYVYAYIINQKTLFNKIKTI